MAPQDEITQSCWSVEQSNWSFSSLPQHFLGQYRIVSSHFLSLQVLSGLWTVAGYRGNALRQEKSSKFFFCYPYTQLSCICDTLSLTEFMFGLAGLLLQPSVKKCGNCLVVSSFCSSCLFPAYPTC